MWRKVLRGAPPLSEWRGAAKPPLLSKALQSSRLICSSKQAPPSAALPSVECTELPAFQWKFFFLYRIFKNCFFYKLPLGFYCRCFFLNVLSKKKNPISSFLWVICVI